MSRRRIRGLLTVMTLAGCLVGPASAQSLRFVGAANNIPFPPSCATSAVQINLAVGAAPTTVSASCNGVSFTCRPATLPNAGGAVWTATLRSSQTGVGTVNLSCAPRSDDQQPADLDRPVPPVDPGLQRGQPGATGQLRPDLRPRGRLESQPGFQR